MLSIFSRTRLTLSLLIGVAGLGFSLPAQAQFETLDDPLAAGIGYKGTYALGSSGNIVVGYYYDSNAANHGFYYNTTTNTYKTIDNPLASPYYGSGFSGIDGTNIVGTYVDNGNNAHGFLFDVWIKRAAARSRF